MAMNKITMEKGFYAIGDPCYMIPREKWTSFVEHNLKAGKINDSRKVVSFDFLGYRCYVSDTYSGDGGYRSEKTDKNPLGMIFNVDSGLIAAIPVPLLIEVGCRDKVHDECLMIEVDEDSVASYDNGEIMFDDVVIQTFDSGW